MSLDTSVDTHPSCSQPRSVAPSSSCSVSLGNPLSEVWTRAAAGAATITVATALPAISGVLAGAPTVHPAGKTLAIGVS